MLRLLRVQKGEIDGVASAYLRHESAHTFPESDPVFYPRSYSPWRLCILLKTIRILFFPQVDNPHGTARFTKEMDVPSIGWRSERR